MTNKQRTFKLAFKKMLDECFRNKEKLEKIIFESENISTSVFSDSKKCDNQIDIKNENINEMISIGHELPGKRNDIHKEIISENKNEKSDGKIDEDKEKDNFQNNIQELENKEVEKMQDAIIFNLNNQKIDQEIEINDQEKNNSEIHSKIDDDVFNTSMTKDFWKDKKILDCETELHEILPLLKHNIKITFKEESRHLLEKLAILDKLEKSQKNKKVKRDIKSKEYIREIYESYNIDDMNRLCIELNEIETDLNDKLSKSKELLKKQEEEKEKMKMEKKEVNCKYNEVFERFDRVIG